MTAVGSCGSTFGGFIPIPSSLITWLVCNRARKVQVTLIYENPSDSIVRALPRASLLKESNHRAVLDYKPELPLKLHYLQHEWQLDDTEKRTTVGRLFYTWGESTF